MNAINELRGKSAGLWNTISTLSKEFDTLDANDRHKIMSYLNEYDHFCTLYNEGLINRRLVRKTRRTTIMNTYNIHSNFIGRWREEYDENAWLNLEVCATGLK